MGENGGMKIGELAGRTGVSVRALRYYEQQGLLAPTRTPAGHRLYGTEHQDLVAWIQELLRAGFCSAVIRELLPALASPEPDASKLGAAFRAAQLRLESEKHSIETELAALGDLGERWGIAPDVHVTVHSGTHDSSTPTPPTPFDHRDRRLR